MYKEARKRIERDEKKPGPVLGRGHRGLGVQVLQLMLFIDYGGTHSPDPKKGKGRRQIGIWKN